MVSGDGVRALLQGEIDPVDVVKLTVKRKLKADGSLETVREAFRRAGDSGQYGEELALRLAREQFGPDADSTKVGHYRISK